jgi:hypothetical protein
MAGAEATPMNRAGRRHGGARPPGRATRCRSTKAVLLSLQASAAEFGIPSTSLRDLIHRGLLPCVRFDGSKRIWLRRPDIEQLIERSTERAS